MGGDDGTGGGIHSTTAPGDPADASGGASSDGSSNGMFDPVAPGLAGFGFAVNDVVQYPMRCPSDHWEFDAAAPEAGTVGAYLINTGQFPVAYIAAAWWTGMGYVPGVPTGDPSQLTGVLAPGDRLDITQVYNGGIVALLGSSAPFSSQDAGTYVASDEGQIPWPSGVAGSEGSSTMWIAEIEIRSACEVANKVW